MSLSPPPYTIPMQDRGGSLSRPWRAWFQSLYQLLAPGGVDKLSAAYDAAVGAAPASRQVLGAGGLQTVGSDLTGNIGIVMYRLQTTVALLPTSGNTNGDWAYATNGRKPGEGAGAGSGTPVFWSKTGWYAVGSGAVVAA